LPGRERGQGGRPPRDPRPIVGALLWLTSAGAAWRELPAVYGAWISPHRYHRRWMAARLWPRILRALQEDEADM
jgi:transposase